VSLRGNSKQRILFIALSILGVMLILFFGLRALRAFKKFDGHRPPPFAQELQIDVEDIEDWMTIPFISHSYGVAPDILFDALNIEPRDNFKKSLKQLNKEYYPDQDGFVIETVKAMVHAHQPPSPPALPNTPVPPPPQNP
jgi:hypothetical protein